MMKKLLLLIVITLNSYSYVQSQILAGHHLSRYSDIIPDTILNPVCQSQPEDFFVDIDKDLADDLKIRAYCGQSPSHTDKLITIEPLGSDFYILYGQKDSVLNTFVNNWMYSVSAKALYYGDTINNSNAVWSNEKLSFSESHYYMGTSISAHNFRDSVDKYAGIKYQSTTDTLYGWIRVTCPYSNQCIIKEYSLGLPVSTGIYNQEISFKLYPNPASTTLTLQTDNRLPNTDYRLQIYNAQGQLVTSSVVEKQTTTLNIEDLSPGLYYLHLQSDEGVAVKKFEVIR